MNVTAESVGPLEIATAVVAGYAALVATLALGFQVFQWVKTWQTQVEVEMRRMSALDQAGNSTPAIVFMLVNHSGHPVKITHLSLLPLRRGGPHLFIAHPLPLPTPGPFEIPARDAVTVYVKPDALDNYDPDWKTRAQVTTSDRRTFKSNQLTVRELL